MNKFFKRLALLLAVLMIVSMMPVQLFATNGVITYVNNSTENGEEQGNATGETSENSNAPVMVNNASYISLENALENATGVTQKATVKYDTDSKTITNVTPDNVQDVLDGKYGSLDGMTVILSAGSYGALELGRATAYDDSNTEYMVGGFDSGATNYQKFDSAEALIAYKNGTGWTPGCYYRRALNNVTLRAADNAEVTIAGLTATSGHIYGVGDAYAHDYVRNIDFQNTNGSYYLAQKWSNVIFEGITFTARVDITSSLDQTTISGTTFKNCTFVGSDAYRTGGIAALRYYNENNNGKVSGLTVENCEFANWFQGIYTGQVKDITVTNSKFITTNHNAIAIQNNSDKGACDHGTVVIADNTFREIGDRIIRFNTVAEGTAITITGNTATYSGKKLSDGTLEVVGATSIANGVSIDVTSTPNSWGENAVLGKGFETASSSYVAKIGDVEYETLADAIAAANDGDTVKLLADVEYNGNLEKANVTIEGAVDSDGKPLYELKGLKSIKADGITLKNVYLNLTGTLEIGGTNTTLKNCIIRAKDVGYRDIVDGLTTAFTGGKAYVDGAFTYLVRVTGNNVSMTDCLIDGTDKENSYFPNMCLCPVSGTDVTMTDCTFNEGYAACYYSTPKGTWTLDNCKFTNIYCYNIQAGDTAANIVVKNCELAGWTSFGSAMASVSFENCSFAKSSGYATVVAYKDATFTNCTFAEDYKDNINVEANTSVDLNGCVVVDANGDVSGTVTIAQLMMINDATAIAAIDATKDENGKYTGGTFVGAESAIKGRLSEGYIPTKNADGTYTVAEFKPFEIWTGFSGTKVAAYKTLAEAVENLGEYKWIVVGSDYTLTEDFTIPEGVYLDVAQNVTLTVAAGVTLTVAANCKRLGVRKGATVVNNGTILVCGTSYSAGYVMLPGTLEGKALSIPDGYFLDNNNNNYFATANENAVYEITFSDGSVKLTADSTNIKGGNVTQIKLLKDVTKGGWSLGNDIGPEVVLDLNGHILSYDGTNRYYATLNVSTKVTIKNGTVKYTGTSRGAIDLSGSADLTIAGDAVIDGGDSYGIFTSGSSKLTVYGKVSANGNYAIAGNGSESAGSIDNCNIIVNDGAVISAPNGIAIYHPELGTVTVNGGKISGHTGIQMCAGKLIVNGGEITSTGANVDHTGSTNAMPDGAAISIVNRNYPGGIPALEIKGGTIKATGKDALAVKAYDYTNNTVATWTDAGEYINISGGAFSNEIPADYCADGLIPTKNADGTYGVKQGSYVAQIGDVKYETLADAIAAAKDGDTVKLLADVEQNSELPITKSITLDLNGKKIYNTKDIWNATAISPVVSLIDIENGAAVTITGNGTITAKENDCYTINVSDGKLTIENGTFVGNISVVQVEKGVLTIKGGSFSLLQKMTDGKGENRYLINCIDNAFNNGTANVAIYGGTFAGFDPNVSPEAKVDGKVPSFAAEGVGITKNEDGSFTAETGMTAQILDASGNSVKAYATLADAIAAAKDGETVKLLADVTVDAQITVNAAITLDLNGKTVTSTWAMASGAGGEARYALLLKADVTVQNGTFAAGKARAIGAYGALKLDHVNVSTQLTDGNACVALCANDKTYTISNTSINGAYALAIFANNATVNVSDSTLTGNGNVLYHNGSNYGLKLNVQNTTIESTGSCGVYISGSTDTTGKAGYQQAEFINCTITGLTAIEVKYTDLTLENCTVKATDTETSYVQSNNGPAARGFAVVSTDNAVGQTTPKPAGSITIKGNGKFTGPVGLGSLASVKETYKDFEDKTIAISGGTFSHEILNDYCAEGYIPTKNADGTYGVTASGHPITSTGLTLGEDISIRIVVDAKYKDGKIKVTYETYDSTTNGMVTKELILDKYELAWDDDKNDVKYQFRIRNITPQMADVVFTLQYLDSEGNKIGSAKQISIVEYCRKFAETSAFEAYKAKIGQLLNYCATAMDLRAKTHGNDVYNGLSWEKRATALRAKISEFGYTVADFDFGNVGQYSNIIIEKIVTNFGIEFAESVKLYYFIPLDNYKDGYTYVADGLLTPVPVYKDGVLTGYRVYLKVAMDGYHTMRTLYVYDANGEEVQRIGMAPDFALKYLYNSDKQTTEFKQLCKAAYQYFIAFAE